MRAARYTGRPLAAAVLALALLASCADLFHSTDWSTSCGEHACGPTGSGAAGASSGGAGVGGTGGEAAGSGGGGGCTPGQTAPCYSGPPATKNVGLCHDGTKTCNQAGTSFGTCAFEVTPVAEICGNDKDESCDGTLTDCGVVASCAALQGQPSGVYAIDPDGGDPTNALQIRCDMDTDGGGWALLYNSVGSSAGLTPAFWQIAFADRLIVKGKPELYENFYAGALYVHGKEYRDEVVDLNGTAVEAFRATAAGFDPDTMAFVTPALVSGLPDIYTCHFAAGWASADHDGDQYDPDNCSLVYLSVTQHYCACWNYNLGADAEDPIADASWGPHANTVVFAPLGIASDGSAYTRVTRISRWARW